MATPPIFVCILAYSTLPGGSLAVREEGVGNYLGRLCSRHVRERSEVRSVLSIAWLSRSTARVTCDYPVQVDTLYPQPERVRWWYIGKRLLRGRDRVDEAYCV